MDAPPITKAQESITLIASEVGAASVALNVAGLDGAPGCWSQVVAGGTNWSCYFAGEAQFAGTNGQGDGDFGH